MDSSQTSDKLIECSSSMKDNQNREYQDSVFVHYFTHYLEKLLILCKALDSSITSEDIELIKLENTLFLKYRAYLLCRLGKNKASTYRYTPTFYFCLAPRIYALYFKNDPKEFHQNINLQSNYLRCILYILIYIRIYKILAECIKNIFDTLLPLRFLEYIGRIFELILEVRDRYARLLIKIPTPEFYVFYTGSENLPAMQELKLSDAFIAEVENPQLELIVKVINLNSKENAELLNKTPDLKEYTEFVNVVKDFKSKYGNNGYDKAIRYCIRKGMLEGILKGKKEGIIKGMLKGLQKGKKEGKEEGIKEGLQKGKKEEQKTLARRMKDENIDIDIIQKITKLSREDIENL